MIQPEGVKVVVRPDVVEEKSKGGIILTPQSRESEQTRVTSGEVVAIGPNAEIEFESGKAKVGQHVLFAKYGGMTHKIDDVEYRILNDEDVVALI